MEEALYWIGGSIFATGLYFLIAPESRTRLKRWAVALTVVGLVIVVIPIFLTHSPITAQSSSTATGNGASRINQGGAEPGGESPPAPGRGNGVFADFSTPQIQANNIHVTPNGAFAYNGVFGGSWRVTALGGGFTAEVDLPGSGTYKLIVTHLTSMDPGCPGRGYSPITIVFDTETVVADYDPSAHHAGDHGMVTDQWSVNGDLGPKYSTMDDRGPLHALLDSAHRIPAP